MTSFCQNLIQRRRLAHYVRDQPNKYSVCVPNTECGVGVSGFRSKRFNRACVSRAKGVSGPVLESFRRIGARGRTGTLPSLQAKNGGNASARVPSVPTLTKRVGTVDHGRNSRKHVPGCLAMLEFVVTARNRQLPLSPLFVIPPNDCTHGCANPPENGWCRDARFAHERLIVCPLESNGLASAITAPSTAEQPIFNG